MDGKIRFRQLTANAQIPEYAHVGDAGMDLRATEAVAIPPGEWRLVKTGLAIEMPGNFEAQVRSRSGLALKHGVHVLNSPGTIDSGYRGEIGVILKNDGPALLDVKAGDRIAQLVIAEVRHPQIEVTELLSASDRSEGGFGSTGLS